MRPTPKVFEFSFNSFLLYRRDLGKAPMSKSSCNVTKFTSFPPSYEAFFQSGIFINRISHLISTSNPYREKVNELKLFLTFPDASGSALDKFSFPMGGNRWGKKRSLSSSTQTAKCNRGMRRKRSKKLYISIRSSNSFVFLLLSNNPGDTRLKLVFAYISPSRHDAP